MDPIRTDQSSHPAASATSGTGNTLEDFGGEFAAPAGAPEGLAGTKSDWMRYLHILPLPTRNASSCSGGSVLTP